VWGRERSCRYRRGTRRRRRQPTLTGRRALVADRGGEGVRRSAAVGCTDRDAATPLPSAPLRSKSRWRPVTERRPRTRNADRRRGDAAGAAGRHAEPMDDAMPGRCADFRYRTHRNRAVGWPSQHWPDRPQCPPRSRWRRGPARWRRGAVAAPAPVAVRANPHAALSGRPPFAVGEAPTATEFTVAVDWTLAMPLTELSPESVRMRCY